MKAKLVALVAIVCVGMYVCVLKVSKIMTIQNTENAYCPRMMGRSIRGRDGGRNSIDGDGQGDAAVREPVISRVMLG